MEKIVLNKLIVFTTLQVLREQRVKMTQDFINHEPMIYRPSYKYESEPVLFRLAKEKYFMAWLSSHWHVFSHAIDFFSIEERVLIERIFARVFLELLEKWSVMKTTDANQLNLGIKLVEDMQLALNELIKSGDKADVRRNQLEMALEKSRVLFDRALSKLSVST